MRSTIASSARPFLSPRWLAELAGPLSPPPWPVRSTVAFRLEISDAPRGTTATVDVRVDLAAGQLSITADTAPQPPALLIRLPYLAARDLLLGAAADRAGVFERGDVVALGNFTLLFFIDAALQQDRSGHVARLRAGTLVTMAGNSPTPAWIRRHDPPTPISAPAVDADQDTLPLTMRELQREVGTSTPGLQLYVSRNGVQVINVALGKARPGVSMTLRSKAFWYCCGKLMLPVALGQLWERGQFDPYLPVAHYLPEFGQAGKEQITSAELLTHTGPVPTGMDPLHGAVAGPDQVRRCLAFEFAPPARGEHSAEVNYSMWWAWYVLAQLLPAIDGRSYGRYVEDEIIGPCGMSETLVTLSDSDYDALAPELPLIYVSNEGNPPQPTSWWSTRAAVTRCIPGVNTRGPVRDIGRLLEMLLAGGTAPGGRVICPTTVAALTARHRTGVCDRYGNADWGLGFRLECRHLGAEYTSFGSFTSRRSYGHDGLWTAVAFADPDAGIAIALHLNGKVEHARHRDRMLRIADAIYRDLGFAQ
jgi:CubicO group peptidase (beta-lactamase class C family)